MRAYEERPALAVAYRSSPPCPYCKCAGSRVLKTWVQPYAGKDRTRWQYKSCADEPGDHANGDAGHRFYVWWPLR